MMKGGGIHALVHRFGFYCPVAYGDGHINHDRGVHPLPDGIRGQRYCPESIPGKEKAAIYAHGSAKKEAHIQALH
jgi:hypothetical protein